MKKLFVMVLAIFLVCGTMLFGQTAEKPNTNMFRFGLFGNLSDWDQRADKSVNGIGYGATGFVTIGFNVSDVYLGIGPQVSASFLTFHAYQYSVDPETYNVYDIGVTLFVEWSQIYLMAGGGTTIDNWTFEGSTSPDDANTVTYTRVGLGWKSRPWAVGASYIAYPGVGHYLGRIEFNVGCIF